MEQQTIQRMALLAPNSWDEETRSASVVISSDADVGDGIQLLHTTEAIRWPSRPLPTDYDHRRTSDSIWGAVTDLTLERAADGSNQLVGRVVVDGPPSAMEIALPRMRTGSARFSVDARVYAWREAGPGEPLVATDWEPQLVSLVPRGQDTKAVMRGEQPNPMETPMTVESQAGGDPVIESTEAPAVAPEAAASVTPEAEADDAVQRAQADKLELVVRRAASEAQLPEDTVQRILSENRGRPQVDALTAVVRELRLAKEAAGPVHAGHPARVAVTRDSGDTIVRAFSDELHRRAGLVNEPTEIGKQALGLTMLEMCRTYLDSRGVNPVGLSKNELVARAFHSTSDFPNLFANVANKSLLAAYAEEPQTWRPLARQRNLPDFKQVSDLQIAGQIVPEPILEGGEYKSGTLTEGKATWNLATYGKRIAVTRQSIINDDLDSLTRVPELMGRGCRLLESNLVWDLITNGANGATVSLDGQALFVSGHNNTVTGAGSTISISGMDKAKQKLRNQKDLANNRINLTPAYLLVPTTLETTALQFLFPTGYAPAALTGTAGPNPFAGGVELIVEPRLDDDSTSVWYLTSSPNRVEMITFGYLAGEAGPTITTTEKRDPDGVELLVRMDFGCTLSDFRGFVRADGTT
ncbi:MAG: hypothetical protein VKM92_09635 [Cyanobacteriota bacterium]|nr:hypothetical protein [Cyanobacteriota bacterium]